MLTHLALALAPTLAVQDSAALHPADVGLFFEIPDPQTFAEAWKGGAIPALLTDEALDGLYQSFGLSGVQDLLAQLPPEVEQQVLPILRGVEGVSVSMQLDLSDIEARVTEGAVVFGILEDLDDLYWETFWVELDADGQAPSMDELGIDAERMTDPFGNRYQLEWFEGMATWTCLGADGAPGGTGLAADWTSDAEFEAYVASQVMAVVGLEVAVEWVDDETAAQMANMLRMVGLMDQEMGGEIPFAEIHDMNGEAPELADLYRLDPATLGLPGGEMIEASLQQHGRTTVMTLGTTSGERVHALGLAAASGQPSADSLAGAGGYDALIAKVHSDEGVALWQGAVLGFQGVPTEGTFADALGNVAALFEFFGFHGAGSAWQTRIADGSYHGRAVRPADDLPRIDLTHAMSLIPGDAVYAQVGTMDPASFWGYVQELSTGEEELLGMLAERGIDIEAGLMGNLGQTFTLWMQPVRSLAPPQVYAVVPVQDGEALMATLDGLIDFVAELETGFKVSHRPYRGSNYTVLDVGVPIGLSPSYAVIDGHLWMSNSSTLIKRRIRAASKGEVEEGEAHPFFADIDPEGLQGAMHFDLGSLVSAYYSTGRAFAGMIPPDMGLPPDLATNLPEPDLFERYLKPETVVTRFIGDELHTTKVSSLGPELPMLGFAAGLAVPMLALQASPMPGEPIMIESGEDLIGIGGGGAGGVFVGPEDEHAHEHELPSVEESITEANLSIIDLGLLIYNLEHDDYPASLDVLTEASASYPEGYLGMAAVPADGWGHALVYERVSKNEYRLRSVGPDGVDDAGAGDDLKLD